MKQYLKSNPNQLDWQKLNIADLGYRLVQEKQDQYLGERVAQWDLELKPRPQHFDKRITVSTPLQKAGAYLLTAKMADGNTSQIIVWLEDTAIVKKPLSKAMYYYVGDAVSGAPIGKANVEFFGYRQRQVGNKQFTIDVQDYAEHTDGDGQLVVQSKEHDNEFQWIVTATTPEGRLAYLGFTNVWSGDYYDSQYNETKVFTITDRPVYRPGQKVQFKFWVRHAQYDQEDKSDFANQTFNVEIQNPKGEKVLSKTYTADAYGGIEGELELPADATLGVYQLYVVNHGGGSFRVEEYKKPEFEVSVDAPTEPVMLGDKIKATIKAKYYFGSPVTDAKVKYKVLRSNYSGTWYPVGRWDWLYGPGYWWFACDYSWYPGWSEWGCKRPAQSWWWRFQPQQPPEVVAEREVPIGAGRHGGSGNRHRGGQVDSSRSGPSIHDYGGSGRSIAAHDRRPRQCAGGAQAVQGVRVARSGLLPRGRFDSCRDAGANAGPQSGARRRHDSPVQNRVQERQAGGNRGAHLADQSRRAGACRAATESLGAGAISAGL